MVYMLEPLMVQHLLMSAKGNQEDEDSLEYIKKDFMSNEGQKLVLENWYDLGRGQSNYCNKSQLLIFNFKGKSLRGCFRVHFFFAPS